MGIIRNGWPPRTLRGLTLESLTRIQREQLLHRLHPVFPWVSCAALMSSGASALVRRSHSRHRDVQRARTGEPWTSTTDQGLPAQQQLQAALRACPQHVFCDAFPASGYRHRLGCRAANSLRVSDSAKRAEGSSGGAYRPGHQAFQGGEPYVPLGNERHQPAGDRSPQRSA